MIFARTGPWAGTACLIASAILLFTSAVHQTPVKAQARVPTWRGDVAPVVYAHCTSCHHPGAAGPFALQSYAEARRWAPQIGDVVASRYMPPWLPQPTGGPHPVHFEGDRSLKPAEVELLTAWVKAGAPEGTGPVPSPPVYASEWALGTPDLLLEMPFPVTEPASGSDLFVNFVLPATLKETRWIRAMEIRPGAGALVHHANVILDRTGSFRAAHPAEWKTGVPGMDLEIDSGDAFDPDSHFLFWKEDSTALVEPPSMPWRLDPGNDLVLNMHLKPTGKPETIRAQVALYFAPKPATQFPMLLQMEHDAALQIPAGDAHFVVTDELRLPVAVDLLGVYPHAHYLCRDMEGWAELPGGVRQPILHITDWDLDRQSVYKLASPLTLPAGTVLHMRYTYDNSEANIHNPHTPPVAVHGGNRATDEMSHLWLQVLPHPDASGVDPRLPLERAWMQDTLEKSPGDPIALYNLAALRQMGGDLPGAEALYRRLLTERGTDVRAMTALGSTLEAEGHLEAAEQQFEAALHADPGDTDAAFDLAELHLHAGRAAAAEVLYREVLQKSPEDMAAAEGLTESLLAQNRGGEAQPILQGVLARHPQDPRAHRLQAMIFAASGDGAGAEEELRRWTALAPADPAAHRALAQVLSARGERVEALAEQQKVVHLLPTSAGDWNDLGSLAMRAGQISEGRTAFARAVALDPGLAAARSNLERAQALDGTH